MKVRERIANCAYAYQGNWKKIYGALRTNEPVKQYDIRENYITIADDEYPCQLRQLQFPPFVLFYKGDITLLQRDMVTMIGSRQLDDYSRMMTGRIADGLKDRFVIVSGLAKGADAESHRHALINGKTIGVTGHGLDIVYPACNADLYGKMQDRHLILSEFPHDTPIRRYHFPWRNRILAALGMCVIVTKAGMKSGTMHTVNTALELGKTVYCLPHPMTDEEGRGCNYLIHEGAEILFDMSQLDDIKRMKR